MLASLHVTRDCNCACTYCNVGAKVGVNMPWHVAQRAVDLVLEREGDEVAGFCFFGGEPLLCFNLIRECVEYTAGHPLARHKRVGFALGTNGSLLTREQCEFFALHDFEVGVSIDGPPAVHDRHRRRTDGSRTSSAALEALRLALDTVPACCVLMTVTAETAPSLSDSVAFLYSLGARTIRLSPDIDHPWSVTALGAYCDQLNRVGVFHYACLASGDPLSLDRIDDNLRVLLRGGRRCGLDRCGMGVRECAVAPSGHIYACEGLLGNDDTPAYRIGHVRTGFSERRIRHLDGARRRGDPKCAGCCWVDRCANACGCTNRALSGQWHIVGELRCALQQIELAHADRAASRLLAKPPALLRELFQVPECDMGQTGDAPATAFALPAPTEAR